MIKSHLQYLASQAVNKGKAICSNVKNNISRDLGLAARYGLGATLAAGAGAQAMADAGAPPIDYTATATTIAGYVPNAAAAGLTIFAVTFGVVIIKRVFMTVA